MSLVFFGREGKCFFASRSGNPWRTIAVAGKGQDERQCPRRIRVLMRYQGFQASARLLSTAAYLSLASVSYAADWAFGPPPPAAANYWENGVPCSIGAPFWAPPMATAAVLPWRSVWLGHFSGGRPYAAGNGQTLIDWRDEKVCFPARLQCQAWVRSLRRSITGRKGIGLVCSFAE